ncbi:hypothetical protein SDC9_126855 [bioreactor metagenome]|uniref:Uncharacterized protein n=1 Tax=bioreactor metagenome TaxID=1076179 RepID=A0A645CSC2_9ZZZZ
MPAEPALAASTAAFNANMFVWKAISSIVFIILPISFDVNEISSIAFTISFIFSFPSSTSCPALIDNLLASPAFFAVFLILLDMSTIVADNSSIAPACSVVPCDNICAPLATCSDAVSTSCDAAFICDIVSLRSFVILFKEFSI